MRIKLYRDDVPLFFRPGDLHHTVPKFAEETRVSTSVEKVLQQIRAAVGPKGIVEDAAGMEPFLTEQRGHYRSTAHLVVRPASTAEVAEVVRLAAEARLPIV